MPRKYNKKRKLHVKKGDEVEVIAGNDKGKTGRVLKVWPQQDKVLVEGINLRIFHDRPSQENPQGGRIEREAAIHASNVMVIDPNTGERARIGRKYIEKDGFGRWVRYSKKSGEIIDQ